MKFLFISICVLFLITPSFSAPTNTDFRLNLNKKYGMFSNRIDHFDGTMNHRFYNQSYWQIDEYATSNSSPVFFFLGGEAPIDFFDFQEVSAIEWAKQHKARYIALEHRYYGVSNPVPDLSTHNMRYLSSEQALADAAVFVSSMQKIYTGPWVVFGCSYSGSLSAWFRAKYPHLVVGSVAPSGPVIPQLNFTQLFANFGNVAPSSCILKTKQAVAQINALFKTENGRSQLSNAFNACKPITPADEFVFKFSITEFLATTAQWQNPPGNQMTQACDIINKASDPVIGWANAFNLMNNAPAPPSCSLFTLDGFLQPYKTNALGNENRSWYWQKCTEFGFFQTGYPGSSIFFGDMTMEKVDFCKHIFGRNLHPNTFWTQTNYGSMKLGGSNILFTNGAYDPWHTLSFNEDYKSVRAVTYEAAHCAPMTAPTPGDPVSLTAARQSVMNFLNQILSN